MRPQVKFFKSPDYYLKKRDQLKDTLDILKLNKMGADKPKRNKSETEENI